MHRKPTPQAGFLYALAVWLCGMYIAEKSYMKDMKRDEFIDWLCVCVGGGFFLGYLLRILTDSLL